MMSKKGKAVILDSTTSYGVFDAKARLKHQNLMQDYEDLQKESDVMRSKLEAAKQRKLILAAEVRFLRKRYKYLVKTKNTSAPQEQNQVQAPNPLKRTKIRKEASEHNRLHREANSKKKILSHGGKEATRQSLTPMFTPVSDSNHKGAIIHVRKESSTPNMIQMFGANGAAVLRKSIAAFDLNQDSVKEASLPSRAPIFDLNEISTGDEDIPSNYEAVKRSIMRGVNEEEQNDLKLSMCRNGGEGSSRVGKRKISWQDPVALRV